MRILPALDRSQAGRKAGFKQDNDEEGNGESKRPRSKKTLEYWIQKDKSGKRNLKMSLLGINEPPEVRKKDISIK